MRFSSQASSDGVTERLFTIGDAPGVRWAPDDATAGDVPRPCMLPGQHMDVPRFEADSYERFFARRLTAVRQ